MQAWLETKYVYCCPLGEQCPTSVIGLYAAASPDVAGASQAVLAVLPDTARAMSWISPTKYSRSYRNLLTMMMCRESASNLITVCGKDFACRHTDDNTPVRKQRCSSLCCMHRVHKASGCQQLTLQGPAASPSGAFRGQTTTCCSGRPWQHNWDLQPQCEG